VTYEKKVLSTVEVSDALNRRHVSEGYLDE
jgi:hypothetical protein